MKYSHSIHSLEAENVLHFWTHTSGNSWKQVDPGEVVVVVVVVEGLERRGGGESDPGVQSPCQRIHLLFLLIMLQ